MNVIRKLGEYFEQNCQNLRFTTGETWVIMDAIEKSVKEKINARGTPLQDWNIKIYRGILTGLNEAFIVSGGKKEEIISRDPGSAEIIRPILRGRDIRRYGFNFADLHLITTFPSLNLDINDYPAVRKHLLSFGIERLEQTGSRHWVNGAEIRSRKKTMNSWFETQDNIAYWEDFFKLKIIYPNMTKYLPFHLDSEQHLVNQKCFIITGELLYNLIGFLNSKLFRVAYKDNFPELLGGTRELSKLFFMQLRVSRGDYLEHDRLVNLINEMISRQKMHFDISIQDGIINNALYDHYQLTTEEIAYVDSKEFP